MTDWLEYILTLAVSHEEEPEELPELPPERTAYAVKKQRGQAALTHGEAAPSALKTGSRLLRSLMWDTAAPADSVPAAILPHGEETPGMAEIESPSENALALLYRRSAEAAESIRLHGTYSGTNGQEKVIVVQEGAPVSVGLTAGELDRAVRRDSRRYDGGMTIY